MTTLPARGIVRFGIGYLVASLLSIAPLVALTVTLGDFGGAWIAPLTATGLSCLILYLVAAGILLSTASAARNGAVSDYRDAAVTKLTVVRYTFVLAMPPVVVLDAIDPPSSPAGLLLAGIVLLLSYTATTRAIALVRSLPSFDQEPANIPE